MSRSRFRNRMLISFLTIIVLPALTLGVFGPILYSREISSLSAIHTRELTQRVTANLESIIRDRDQLMQTLLGSWPVGDFYAGGGENGSHPVLEELFSSTAAYHPEIAAIMAVTDDDRMYSRELRRILRDPLVEEDWYVSAVASGSDFNLVTRPIGRNLINTSGTGSDEIVSMIRTVRDAGTREPFGILMMDLSLDFLAESLRAAPASGSDSGSGFFCILDTDGEFVYAPVNPVVYRINPDWFIDSGLIVEKTIQGKGYRFIFSESAYTGWKTVGVYDLENAMRPVRFVQVSALIIAFTTIAVSVIVSMVYTNAVSKPVMQLQSVMEKAGHGDLAVRYTGHSGDEIDELGEGLNAMLARIEELLQLVYREQQSKRDAELRIMQQQIKPHFLYNTLDTILWMAEENQSEQVAGVVTALTRLFRIALSQGQEIIRLQDETDHVSAYLTIQKTRYEDKFEFVVDCPDELLDLQVQKMILQPLVENSIYHGIKEKRGPGLITVNITRREDVLHMTVRDDGVGISPEVLSRINEGLEHLDHGSDRTAFALYNVNDRIRLTYGGDFGISITSEVGTGTEVEIRHPVIHKEASP